MLPTRSSNTRRLVTRLNQLPSDRSTRSLDRRTIGGATTRGHHIESMARTRPDDMVTAAVVPVVAAARSSVGPHFRPGDSQIRAPQNTGKSSQAPKPVRGAHVDL